MSEHPKYEYKFVVVNSQADENGVTHSLANSDVTDPLNKLGLEGWVLRSHTVDHTSKPILITAMLIRKI